MAKKKEIQFSLNTFEIGNFSSTTPESTVRKDRLDFQIQHQFDVDAEKKLFRVGFRIKVMPGRQSTEELAAIETYTTYKVKGVDQENMFSLPDHLVVTFLSIAYSNTRGALAAKAQGTIVGEVPLPLISPTRVIEDMKRQAEADE